MWKNITIFITSVLIGFLIINQYQAFKEAQAISNRDTNISYVEQINLLVATNQKLKMETKDLKEQIGKLKSTANIHQTIEEDILKFKRIGGSDTVRGSGIKLVLDFSLESFWLVDLINELSTAGTEAVTLNKERILNKTGFVSQSELDNTIFLNNKTELQDPFIIEAIGDPEHLFRYLSQENGIIKRLQESYPEEKNNIILEIKENIMM